MREFGDETCIKCGCIEVTIVYEHPNRISDDITILEHLVYTCTDCNYSWCVKTKDYKEQKQ